MELDIMVRERPEHSYAMKWTGENTESVVRFIYAIVTEIHKTKHVIFSSGLESDSSHTLVFYNGNERLEAEPGQWIIKKGLEWQVLSEKDFRRQYEPYQYFNWDSLPVEAESVTVADVERGDAPLVQPGACPQADA